MQYCVASPSLPHSFSLTLFISLFLCLYIVLQILLVTSYLPVTLQMSDSLKYIRMEILKRLLTGPFKILLIYYLRKWFLACNTYKKKVISKRKFDFAFL